MRTVLWGWWVVCLAALLVACSSPSEASNDDGTDGSGGSGGTSGASGSGGSSGSGGTHGTTISECQDPLVFADDPGDDSGGTGEMRFAVHSSSDVPPGPISAAAAASVTHLSVRFLHDGQFANLDGIQCLPNL